MTAGRVDGKMEKLEVVNQILWCFLQWGILGLVMLIGDAGARISPLRLPQGLLLCLCDALIIPCPQCLQ